jgi:hypothetical protein
MAKKDDSSFIESVEAGQDYVNGLGGELHVHGSDASRADAPAADGDGDETFDPARLRSGNAPASAPEDDNLFDPEKLRLSQDFADDLGVKVLLNVPVRKPSNQTFFRVHPDPNYRLAPAAVIELKEQRETYLVPPALVSALGDEITYVNLLTAIDRSGNLFLWPIKLPASDGRTNDWHQSAFRTAQLATTSWVRLRSNMEARCYEAFKASSDLSEPHWPEVEFREILKAAFQDRIINDLKHPVILKLHGAI